MNRMVNVKSCMPVKPAMKPYNTGSKTSQNDNFQEMISQADENHNSGKVTEQPGKPSDKTEESKNVQVQPENPGQEAVILPHNGEVVNLLVVPEPIQVFPETVLTQLNLPVNPAEKTTEQNGQTADLGASIQNSAQSETEASAFNQEAAIKQTEGQAVPDEQAAEAKQKVPAEGSGIETAKSQDNGKTNSQMEFAGNQNSANVSETVSEMSRNALQNQSEQVDARKQDESVKPELLQESSGQEALSKASAGETVRIKVADPGQGVNRTFSEEVSANVQKSMSLGKEEVVIQLEPEHLGKIVIKIAFHEDGAKVLMNCSNSKTLGLLTENAKDIGNIVTHNTGNATVVEVKQEETGYWNQQKDSTDEHSNKGNDGQNQENHRKPNENEAADFVQQLRLGLFGAPEITERSLYL